MRARSMRRVHWLVVGVLLCAPVAAVALNWLAPTSISTIPVGLYPGGMVVDGRDGRAFVLNGGDSTVSVLDTRSRRVLHTVAVGRVPNAVAVDRRNGHVFVTNNVDQTVSAFDAQTGALIRTIAVDSYPFAVAVDEQSGHAFVSTGGETPAVSMLDTRTAVLIRTSVVSHSCACLPSSLAVDTRTGRAFATASGDGTVSVLDTRSGVVLRTVRAGAGVTTVAVDEVTERAFVVNSGDNTVRVLDARTGAPLRTISVGKAPMSAIVDTRMGRVFVPTTTGTSILDARTGRVIRTAATRVAPAAPSINYPLNMAIDTAARRAFVIDAPIQDRIHKRVVWSLSVLDTRSGRVLRHVPLHHEAMALSIDAATHSLFVANEDTIEVGTANDPWGWMPQAVRHWIPWLSGSAPMTRRGSVTVFDTTQL